MGRHKKSEVVLREIKTKEKKENSLFDLIENGDKDLNQKDNKIIKIKIIIGYNILLDGNQNLEYAEALKEYLCGKTSYYDEDEDRSYDEDNSVMLEEFIMDSIPGLDTEQDIRVFINRPYVELDMLNDTTIEFIGISGKSDFASFVMTELPNYLMELQKSEDFISFLKSRENIDFYEDDKEDPYYIEVD